MNSRVEGSDAILNEVVQSAKSGHNLTSGSKRTSSAEAAREAQETPNN